MTDNRFRTVAYTLREYIANTYDLLNATDAVLSLDSPSYSTPAVDLPHDLLVAAALGSETVMNAVKEGRRIEAIKALRNLGRMNQDSASSIGLRAAKEAIEDYRVYPLG